MGTSAIGLLLAGACATASTARDTFGWEDSLDDEHAGVVLLSNDCSGTLVGPRWVLTAAHCAVRTDEMPRVRVGRIERDVLRCRLHPDAWTARTRCLDDPGSDVDESHDLAILELAEPIPATVARPMRVLLHMRYGERYLDERRLFLVGWHRRPLQVGAARRYGGWNSVVSVRGGRLVTLPLPDDPQRFSTRPGASGGPALLRREGREWVVGVLSGGRTQLSADSTFAYTAHADNARFIRGAIRMASTTDI